MARQVHAHVTRATYICDECDEEYDDHPPSGSAAQRVQRKAKRHTASTGHMTNAVITRTQVYRLSTS